VIERVVEAHDAQRRDGLAVLDPEGAEAGHAGHAAGVAVGPVAVPEVADEDAGAERPQGVVGHGQVAGGDGERLGVLAGRVDLGVVLLGAAGVGEAVAVTPGLDER
jgi:hypothetical protein